VSFYFLFQVPTLCFFFCPLLVFELPHHGYFKHPSSLVASSTIVIVFSNVFSSVIVVSYYGESL